MNPEKTMQDGSKSESKEKNNHTGLKVGAAMLAGVAAGEVPAQDAEPESENPLAYTQEVDVKQTQEQYLEIRRQQYEKESRQERAFIINYLKTQQAEGNEMTPEDQKTSGYSSIVDALEGTEKIIISEVERKLDLDRQILDIQAAGNAALEISQRLKETTDNLSAFVHTVDNAMSNERPQSDGENPADATDDTLEKERLKAIDEKTKEIQSM